MKQYENYKPTGIKWVEKIPSHWEINRIKYLIRKRISDGPHESPEFINLGIPFLSVDGIQNGELVFDGCRFISESEHKRFQQKTIVEKGDILMGKAASIGKIARVKVEFDFSVWSPLAIIKPNQKINNVFFEYYLKSTLSQYQIETLCTSNTQKNISMEDIPKIIVVLPPREEQTAIANFLDEKTAQIDNLISNKQKLIDLLVEERISIIDKAVIGEDKNWPRKKLKYVVSKVGSGVTPKGGANVYLLEGIPLLRSQNIFSNRLVLDDVAYISDEIDNQMSNSRIQEGDVLLNITGASIGRCFYVPPNFGNGNVNQHVCIIRPIQTVIRTKYLHSFLVSNLGQTQINMCQNGANREGLNFQQLKAFEIPLPSLKTQDEVLRNIQAETLFIENTISKIENEIELMKEYKTALISEAVTGNIKVI